MENDNKEIEKRDLFIYENIISRYHFELERTQIIDGKSANLIGFIGIILSLEAGFYIFILKNVVNINIFYKLIFLFSMLFLLISFIFGIKVHYIKSWEIVPNPRYLIEEYAKKEKSKIDLIRVICNEMADSTINNKGRNDEKIICMKYSYIFLLVGIILNIFYVTSISLAY